MGSFRRDPITKEWTIISPSRKKRPEDTGVVGLKKNIKIDPFAPGSENETPPEVFRIGPGGPNTPGWEVRVISNKYPVVPHHEVIIHSPDPRKDIEELPDEQVTKIIQTYLNRFKYYDDVGYTHIFCNHGKDAGASLKHPHSQLVVLKHIPESILEEILGAQNYYLEVGRNPYNEEIKKAQFREKRLVYENGSIVVICPFASEWPYETMVFPKHQEDSFSNISGGEIKDLAEALKKTLYTLKTIFGDISYNFWIHSSNTFLRKKHPGKPISKFYRWHFEIIPRIKKLGGIELGTEIMVVDRDTPEIASAQFREAIRKLT